MLPYLIKAPPPSGINIYPGVVLFNVEPITGIIDIPARAYASFSSFISDVGTSTCKPSSFNST